MADDTFDRLKSALADRYRLERLVGQGGMATVYLAEDLKHHRQVAIKVLRPDLSAALGADRFLREIELAAKLQHPHIVPVYDSGNADGILYYVMPFVEGESLRDLMQREKRILLTRAAEIVRAAASGLAYAHAQGIVHRDVKPENIMLSGGLAVVTDFGIARAIDASRNTDANLTGAGMAMGTPAYMSPEQATADKVDARTDQYALACVFYEMVSGKQAFAAPTMQAMLASILTGPRPKLVSSVDTTPPGVDAATQRALATDPEKRFPNITEFANAVAQEGSAAAAATRESRRWKMLAFGTFALAVVAAGYATIFSGPKRTVVSGAETIAVMPFTTSGPGLEGMGEGMVDLLATNLDGVGAIHAIEPRTVLLEWRKRVKNGETDLVGATEIARATKAASVLTGSIISAGGTARLTADLYDLEGKSLAQYQVSGPSDSVLVLADSLALGILHAIWRSREPLPSANSAAITSTSMPAIRAYLRGERAHRQGAWDSAAVAFQEAVQADSTFALAWYRLASTLGWMGQYRTPPSIQAASNAAKFADGLPRRLRSLMNAYSLFAQGDVAATDSMVFYTREFPNDADGWFLLGESMYHTLAYQPHSPAEIRAPFDKVLALDSSLTPAAIHPMELALQERDTTLLKRYQAIFRSGGDSTDLRRLDGAMSVMRGEETGLATFASGGLGAGVTRGVLVEMISRPGWDADSVLKLTNVMRHTTAPGGLADVFRLQAGLIIAGTGQVDSAIGSARSVKFAGTPLDSILMSYPVAMGFANQTQLAVFDSLLSTRPKSPPLLFWQALTALDRGNPAKAAAIVKTLLPANSPPMGFLYGPSVVLDGLIMVANGDTLRGMVRADSGMRILGGSPQYPFGLAAQVRYAQVELQRPATRATGIARLRYSFTSNLDMMPLNSLRIGKAYEAADYPDSAAMYYQRFLNHFKPDSAYAGLVADAKIALARVTKDRPATAPVGGKP